MSDPSPNHADFEVVDNQYPDRNYDVKISLPEFTCVCPRTGQPDFATIEIIYIPNKEKIKIIKAKSIYEGVEHKAIITNKIINAKIINTDDQDIVSKRMLVTKPLKIANIIILISGIDIELN